MGLFSKIWSTLEFTQNEISNFSIENFTLKSAIPTVKMTNSGTFAKVSLRECPQRKASITEHRYRSLSRAFNETAGAGSRRTVLVSQTETCGAEPRIGFSHGTIKRLTFNY